MLSLRLPTSIEKTVKRRRFRDQLPKKLEHDPANPRLIITESGIGHRLVVDEYGDGEGKWRPETGPEV